jgi:pheromone shutdown protein TraB
MRKLVYVRIVHTSADMGSLGEELIQLAISKIGREKWEENQRLIEKFWDELEKEIFQLNLDLEQTRIYQDGLPCEGEMGMKIVRSTAGLGSKNYQIIEKMVAKGARIVATENPELLIEERNLALDILKDSSTAEKEEATKKYIARKDILLEQRDAYIASKINNTLENEKTGVLFIGAEHNVIPKLAEDIEVLDLVKH